MRFTESHEWLSLEGKIGTVGITDHAQKELGEIVYVELPKVGQIIKAGQEVCVLESTKAAVDVYAPASGKVVAVNETLLTNPSLLNREAEKEGWLFRLELIHEREFEKLLSRADYETLIS